MPSACCLERDDDRTAAAVMEVVFEHHPAHLSLGEIVRCLAADPVLCDGNDVRDAIGDLASVGLLHRCGEFVFATLAALRAAELGI
jgi:hypothetical protein